MRTTSIHVSIDDLPNEILAQILNYISNLQTLDALLKASPKTFRLFPTIAGEVLESVLDASSAEQVIRLIRIVAVIRACPSLSDLEPTLDGFLKRYINKIPEAEISQPDAPSLTKTLQCQNHNTLDKRATLARSLLVTARRVAWLADAAVDYFRENLVAAKPQHTVKKNAHYVIGPYYWRPRYEGRSYKLHFGPLRWTEQQRLYRALWRLEIVGHLQQAATSSSSGWTELENNRILVSDRDLLSTLFHEWMTHLDELLAMADFITQQYHQLSSWLLPPPQQISNDTKAEGISCWPARELDESRPLVTHEFELESDGSRRLRSITMMPFSPIRDVATQYFYHLGIPFWYNLTLRDLQLARSSAWTNTSAGDDHFTWRSLLSQEKISAIEEAFEERARNEDN